MVGCPAAGINVVFDPVGGPLLTEALRTLAWGAHILTIGFAAGEPSLPFTGSLEGCCARRGWPRHYGSRCHGIGPPLLCPCCRHGLCCVVAGASAVLHSLSPPAPRDCPARSP